jgi:hypothetical protein
MKNKFLAMLLLTFTCGSSFVHAQYGEEFLQKKVHTYRKMQTTGFVLLGTGSVTTLTGIIMISSADWYTTTDYNGKTTTTTDDPIGFAGMGVTIVGVALLASGTVFAIIGSSKTKSYQKKLQNLSIVPAISPKQAGFQLTYKF